MGSVILPVRRTQATMSDFVEVGRDDDKKDPVEQAVFDRGAGVCANYAACGVGSGRMDKIFLNQLHSEHRSDLTHAPRIRPSQHRKTPLHGLGAEPLGLPLP